VKVWSLPLLALLTLPVACKRSGNRTVYADVPAAGSLKEGAPVKFRGIDIGLVRKLTLLRSGVRLELLIQRPDAPLQINDRVAVRPTGTFADEVVEIVPGPASARPLRDRDSLQSVPPDSLATVRDALTRAIVHEFTERWSRTDSTKPGKTAAPAPRP
jgi:ABC-type transporter Mla subunit MlaD